MWIVMSGGTSLKRAFDTNATGLTEQQAKDEAARRNAVERSAGRGKDQVLWYEMEWPPHRSNDPQLWTPASVHY